MYKFMYHTLIYYIAKIFNYITFIIHVIVYKFKL